MEHAPKRLLPKVRALQQTVTISRTQIDFVVRSTRGRAEHAEDMERIQRVTIDAMQRRIDRLE
jgi:hypothetical protein